METLSRGLDVYGTAPAGAARGTQECPERGTSTAPLPQLVSGSFRLANIPPWLGEGETKEFDRGVYWANLIQITGNVIYAFLTTSEMFTSALMP